MRKSVLNLTLAAAAAFATPAWSADPPAAAPSQKQLSTLCDGCALVTQTKADHRKGKASGVGAVGGAVAGGVVGKQVGDSTLATGAGAVVGGLLGHEAEKRLKREKVWVVTAVGRDGRSHRFEAANDPGFKVGDTVRIGTNGAFTRVK